MISYNVAAPTNLTINVHFSLCRSVMKISVLLVTDIIIDDCVAFKKEKPSQLQLSTVSTICFYFQEIL